MASQSIAGTIGKVLLGIVVLIIIVYFFFANSFIKAIAEKEIGNAHGAQVDIASIDHTLFPITITIDGIEITDAHAPKFNQIQVGQVKADVEFIPLLSQKVIVDNVLIDKVAFSQLRAQAGDVYRQPGPSLQDILARLPSKDDIPTKDELLARSALQTPEAVKAAKETKAKYIEPLQAAAKSLPTKADIAAYKAQFNTLKQTNFNDPVALLNAKKQWDDIKAKIKTDKTNIQEFNALASTANTAIKAQITLLQSSTKADYQLLQGAIVGDSDALAQMTQMVFGAKAQQFNKTLLMVINTVTPMFATKPDEPVTAIDLNAKYPNLLVKQAQVNLNVGAETITSQWQNITDQHMITNIPTTFDVQASNGKLWQALTMSGNFEILANGINAQQQ
ncbi:MAG: TIGR03545 family protein [Glaciecola sp.]|nr:TIGR03545 family protein [Glaciecola sp.]